MSGITDLKEILNSLKVSCDSVPYGFASIPDDSGISHQEVLATFKEDDRLAIIAPQLYLESKGIEHEGPYAKLTIDAHTSLELVGLTAVMATELAGHSISTNVVAAFYPTQRLHVYV